MSDKNLSTAKIESLRKMALVSIKWPHKMVDKVDKSVNKLEYLRKIELFRFFALWISGFC